MGLTSFWPLTRKNQSWRSLNFDYKSSLSSKLSKYFCRTSHQRDPVPICSLLKIAIPPPPSIFSHVFPIFSFNFLKSKSDPLPAIFIEQKGISLKWVHISGCLQKHEMLDLILVGKNATWRWQWAHLVIYTCDKHYHDLNIIKYRPDRQTDGRTDRQKVTHKSPVCISTGGLKNGGGLLLEEGF